MRLRSVLIIAGAALVIAALPELASAQDYRSRFDEGLRLERVGQVDEAILVLEDLQTSYPQDYAIALQLGWLHFQADNYMKAEIWYRRASDLSNGALDARLGLAWTHLRQQKLDVARQEFETLRSQAPDDERIAEGIAALKSLENTAESAAKAAPGDGVRGYVSTVAHIFTGDVRRDWGAGVAAGLSAFFANHASVGVGYRFTHVAVPGTQRNDKSMSPQEQDTPDINQHEVWGSMAVYWPVAGVQFVGGWMTADGGEFLADAAWTAGGIARLSLWGDVFIEAGTTHLSDEFWTRLAPSWRWTLPANLALTLGGALQLPDEEDIRGSGMVQLEWLPAGYRLAIGGLYGNENQPTYLGLGIFNNIGGNILFSGWLGAAVTASNPSFSLMWSVEQQEFDSSPNADGQERILAHFVSFSISWRNDNDNE